MILFLLLLGIPSGGAAASLTVSISPGNGPNQLGFVVGNPEGPDMGPKAVLAGKNGFFALDALNQRICSGNNQGPVSVVTPLPTGRFHDLAMDENGVFWLMDEATRTVFSFRENQWQTVFSIPTGEGYPKQFNSYVWVGGRLLLGDFATRKLFFFSESGEVVQTLPWPLSLSLVAGPRETVFFLADSGTGEDRYDTLVFLAKDGKQEKRLTIKDEAVQEYLGSARLLGFSPSGKALAFGWKETDPTKILLFSIDPKGRTQPVETFQGPPAFAVRYGSIAQGVLWLNVTTVGGTHVQIRKIDVQGL